MNKNINIKLDIDDKIISIIDKTITQKNIVKNMKLIKEELFENGVPKDKVCDVYDVSIEILQNILKYSNELRMIDEDKKEADGSFVLCLNTKTKEIKIHALNNIKLSQMEEIKERIKETDGLDRKEIRKLIRQKMRSRKDVTKNGAGLGFLTIASKISKPIEVNFQSISEKVVNFKIKVKI